MQEESEAWRPSREIDSLQSLSDTLHLLIAEANS